MQSASTRFEPGLPIPFHMTIIMTQSSSEDPGICLFKPPDGETPVLELRGITLLPSHLRPGLVVPVGGARGVVVIVVGNEHGDSSSNPGRD